MNDRDHIISEDKKLLEILKSLSQYTDTLSDHFKNKVKTDKEFVKRLNKAKRENLNNEIFKECTICMEAEVRYF